MLSLRDSLFIAALLNAAAAPLAFAAPTPGDAPVLLAQATPSDDDDEDEDDAPAAATPASDEPTSASDAPAASPASPAAEGSAPTSSAQAQQLVSGAPLFNPNVKVHVIEKKPYTDKGTFEIAIYPAAVQINGKFTQTIGSFGSLIYHLQENFALQITGGYNWWNVESGFNGELVEKYRVEAQAATSLLWTWAALGGVEVTPFNGKFVLFDGILGRFSFIINGGLGAGGTRHQLKPQTTRADGVVSEATYGDTGVKFMGSIGAGFKVQLGEHVAIRLEVRDVVYTARMETVNGCSLTDLTAMDAAVIGGREPNTVTGLSTGCLSDSFSGVREEDGYRHSSDAKLAKNLVQTQSSDVLNNVGLYAGVSFIF